MPDKIHRQPDAILPGTGSSRRSTPLERSLRPSCMMLPVVLISVMLLTRMRLPPLPYSLLVIAGIWLLCFIIIYLWQVQRARSRRS